MTYQVLLFYKYITIEKPVALAEWIRFRASYYRFTGRVIVAEEGVNATLEGETEATEKFVAELMADSRFKDVDVKRSRGEGNTFPKLSVKVRKEIVATGLPLEEADPRVKTAPRLKPQELREWYEKNKDFVVVDMRNGYEFASGHFANSIDPGLEASRDLPKALPKLLPLKEKTVLTVCTGGVRCEKMSAYLLSNGFKNVYQLENGIHSYMEKYPGKDYRGTLYTFDGRVTMDFGGEREIIGTCRLCSAKTEHYVNCANNLCHLHFIVCESCMRPDGTAFCGEACASKSAVIA